MAGNQPFSISNLRITPITLESDQLLRRNDSINRFGPTVNTHYFLALVNRVSQGLIGFLGQLNTSSPDRITVRLGGIKAARFGAKKYDHAYHPQYSQVPITIGITTVDWLLMQTDTVDFEEPLGRG